MVWLHIRLVFNSLRLLTNGFISKFIGIVSGIVGLDVVSLVIILVVAIVWSLSSMHYLILTQLFLVYSAYRIVLPGLLVGFLLIFG